MIRWNYKELKPYLWLGVGMLLLSGLFMLIHTTVLSRASLPIRVDAAQSMDARAKVYTDAASFHVLDEFKGKNSMLPQFTFGPLQIVKPKSAKGIQAIFKNGRILHSYVTPDRQSVIYFVQRIEQQAGQGWTQIDMVLVNPETQQIVQKPISFAYGDHLEAIAASTQLSGFISKDEFMYTTVVNTDQEWVYVVNDFHLNEGTVTPLLELFRYEALPGDELNKEPPIIYYSGLAVDHKHLLVRDSLNGITSYALDNGTKSWMLPGSNERKSGEQFDIVGDNGNVLYSPNRFQSDTWWIDMRTGVKRQPFIAERGYIEAGMDAKEKVIYYNFTNDRTAASFLNGTNQSLLLSQGVQLLDMNGNPLRRFTLPKGSKELLEFGGYSEAQKVVLLHKYTPAVNQEGQQVKNTSGWLIGDMTTGTVTPLKRLDVPDGWEPGDVVTGTVSIEPYSIAAEQQAFVHLPDQTYYLSHWKTKQIVQLPEEDTVIFADESNSRVFVSSFSRPDLVVAASNYKKYNWDNQSFRWMKGSWISRHLSQPEGDKIYLFHMN